MPHDLSFPCAFHFVEIFYFVEIFDKNERNLENVKSKNDRNIKKVTQSNKYMFKIHNRRTRTTCEICSKLAIKTAERCHWPRFDVFTANFEHISYVVSHHPAEFGVHSRCTCGDIAFFYSSRNHVIEVWHALVGVVPSS